MWRGHQEGERGICGQIGCVGEYRLLVPALVEVAVSRGGFVPLTLLVEPNWLPNSHLHGAAHAHTVLRLLVTRRSDGQPVPALRLSVRSMRLEFEVNPFLFLS